MSDRFFLDTNIFVCTFDESQPDKRDRAQELVAAGLSDSAGIVSFQVVQEFLNVATRKFVQPLRQADCVEYLDSILAPMCEVFPSIDLYRSALEIQERWKIPFYDSLIIGAALTSGCERLYSEDLQDGQVIRELTVENPFRDR